jgi:Domain of unknown function (DUF4164)
MSSTFSLETALMSLDQAVQLLEAASARRNSRDDMTKSAEAELALMRMDRTRLAEDLDRAVARGNALDSARSDVATRLERAIATIRNTLGSQTISSQ